MFADTDAIRALGSDADDHADELASIAVSLSSLPGAAAEMLGPIGAEFMAALATAITDGARAAAALGDRFAATGGAARASALAYARADHDAGVSIGGV